VKLLNLIIDKLQATFPPNRIMLLLAGPIVAASAWTSALVSANIPGVELPVGIVAGIIGGAVLIAITLIYKWFDQWQRGEAIDFGADLEEVVEQFVAELQTDPEARRELLEHVRELASVAPVSSEPEPQS